MVHIQPVQGGHEVFLVDTAGFDATRYCGVYVLRGPDATVLVETGASPTVDRVLQALDELDVDRGDVTHVAPTHIHLDHAGATGHLLRELPNAQAVLHERYAKYLQDPAPLLESVKEAVGDRFPQYGTCLPIPPERVLHVTGGETLTAGERTLTVRHAPGHAPHHVVYHDPDDGTLYTGDAAGMLLPANDALEVTTPPPAFDLDAYHTTLQMQRDLHPQRLALTHYGIVHDPDAHLVEYAELLDAWVDEVLAARDEHGDDLPAIADHLMDAHPEWAPAYTDQNNRAIRRMDAQGVLRWHARQEA